MISSAFDLLNNLLNNLFLFTTKPIHNDTLQSLIFLKEYNIIYQFSTSNKSFKENTISTLSAPHSVSNS